MSQFIRAFHWNHSRGCASRTALPPRPSSFAGSSPASKSSDCVTRRCQPFDPSPTSATAPGLRWSRPPQRTRGVTACQCQPYLLEYVGHLVCPRAAGLKRSAPDRQQNRKLGSSPFQTLLAPGARHTRLVLTRLDGVSCGPRHRTCAFANWRISLAPTCPRARYSHPATNKRKTRLPASPDSPPLTGSRRRKTSGCPIACTNCCPPGGNFKRVTHKSWGLISRRRFVSYCLLLRSYNTPLGARKPGGFDAKYERRHASNVCSRSMHAERIPLVLLDARSKPRETPICPYGGEGYSVRHG